MIDLVHNSSTGYAVVHDEPALAGLRRLLVGRDGRCRFVLSDGRILTKPRAAPADMLAGLRKTTRVPIILVSGAAAAIQGDIDIYTSAV